MKRKVYISILLLAVTVFACTPVRVSYNQPEGPRFVGMIVKEPPDFDGEVKVVTYNVKLGEKIQQTIHELESVPELKDADVIFMQEMDPEGVNDIAHHLHYNFVYYPAALHPAHEKDFGNAIITKWPIKGYEKIILPHENPIRKMYRIAVFATLDMGELDILTCCVHTEIYIIGYEKKMEQVKAVVEHIKDDYPYVIVGGDFNTVTEDQVTEMERIFRDAGFLRATKYVGSTQQLDPLGLFKFEFDHIFSRGFEVMGAGKVKEAKASDHVPVWAVLKIKK